MIREKWSNGVRLATGALIVAILFTGWFGPCEVSAAPLDTANVMAPLHIDESAWGAFEGQLTTVKKYGVDAVSVDVWWGTVKGGVDQSFDWSYYDKVFSTIKKHGLKIVPILSFHQCGGNVGDTCNILLPSWLWTKYVGKTFNGIQINDTDLQYKSEQGHFSRETVQLWADALVISEYTDFARSFKDHYSPAYDTDFIEINLSTGPSGELRYPSYNAHDTGTGFPTRGALQCYSRLAIRDFQDKMLRKYGNLAAINGAWTTQLTDVSQILPPSDADNFFRSGSYRNLQYGKDFIDWYNQSLVDHGKTLLSAAIGALGNAFPSAKIGYKIPGVHWAMTNPAYPRAAEIASGLIQTSVDFNDDATGHGYAKIVGVTKELAPTNRKVVLHFTCLEMDDQNFSPRYSLAKSLVFWVANEARRQGVTIKGENALADGVTNDHGWDNICNAFDFAAYSGLTVLRIGEVSGGIGQARYSAFIQKYRVPQVPSLFIRGTNNSWSTTAMHKRGTVWSLNNVVFGNSGAERFKFDVYGDWRQTFGGHRRSGPAVPNGSDIAVQPQKSYNITFDEANRTFTVTPSNNTPTWYFRGTPNQWNVTPMTHVTGDIFQAVGTFTSDDPAPRFKIDHFGDWKESFPNQDYPVGDFGCFEITFNQTDKQIDVKKLRDPATGVWGNNRLPLGAVYSPNGTTFRLWSPDTANVQLCLDGKTYPMAALPADKGLPGVYTLTIPGDKHLKRYHFLVNGRVARDPYGVMVDPGTNDNVVVNLARTEPAGGWAPRPPLKAREDSVIYEIHVRDFTIDPSSGVDPEKRGKFLGMVQGGTTYQGKKTGIDHLKELGITHVQILPFFSFRSCSGATPNCYNWGYDPVNFNVPEECYALHPDDPVERIRELKTMINEFHKAGIRVIMDVVYNHTADDGAEDTFSPITRKYFVGNNLSGTGNAVDDRQPMVRRFIRDSLDFWVREFHVDGFRFDLMGIFEYSAVGDWGRYLNQQFPDAMLLIYGEPWEGGGGDPLPDPQRVRLGTVGHIVDAHVGAFNDQYRIALKGDNNSSTRGGYIFNQPNDRSVRAGSRGAIRFVHDPTEVLPNLWDQMFANAPEQTINYVSAHDDLILRDKILLWAKDNHVDNQPKYLTRIQKFANGIILTSQGIPFLHGGDEMLRDKQGNKNSYNAGDEVNKIRWQWKIDNADVFDYHRKVVAMRRSHPGFRITSWDQIDKNIKTDDTLRYGVVVNRINAAVNGDGWQDIIVIYNSADNFDYALPDGRWYVALEKSDPTAGQDRPVQGKVTAEGTAVTVLHR